MQLQLADWTSCIAAPRRLFFFWVSAFFLRTVDDCVGQILRLPKKLPRNPPEALQWPAMIITLIGLLYIAVIFLPLEV